MNLKKSLTGVLAGSLLAGSALVAMAGSASANDEGPDLPGQIFMFKNTGGFSNPLNTVDAISTSGTHAARPFQSMTVDVKCPEGSKGLKPYVRVPQAGVPESEWTQIPIAATSGPNLDSEGRYFTPRGDLLIKPELMTWLATQPNQTGEVPLIAACQDDLGIGLGVFRTTLTVSGTETNFTWSVPAPTWPVEASTTTLAASASTIESGASIDLTATVAPVAATGQVEFFAGSASLGTAAVSGGTATLTTSALPVGTVSVTAAYAGDAAYGSSTSGPVVVEVTPVAERSTVTVLDVDLVDGPAYQAVTLTTTVTASTGAANGTVTFKDGATTLGSVPVVAGVVPGFTTNALAAGNHELVAEFTGTAPYGSSVSAPVAVSYALVGAAHEQDVTVDIPVGAISITSPYTAQAPLALGTAVLDTQDSTYSASAWFDDIVITDTRGGNLGFTASVMSGAFENGSGGSFPGSHAGLTELEAQQVVDNALQASAVVLTDHAPATDGLATPKVFASYAAGQSLGTAHVEGRFGIDQVPTSVVPGTYTATVTLTAV